MVTHAGGKKLEEPLRHPADLRDDHQLACYAKLDPELPRPAAADQPVGNVVRWEMRTRLFLRTTEFLWQEGHTCHATEAEAEEETLQMLEVYRTFAEEWHGDAGARRAARPRREKFAGALHTYCIEAMMQDRKALQAGTSHNLGQNFAKAFDIQFQGRDGQAAHVWPTSWGVSTRLIGGLIMTHSDDEGLVVPPRLAPTHVVIVPIVGKAPDAEKTQVTGRRRTRWPRTCARPACA